MFVMKKGKLVLTQTEPTGSLPKGQALTIYPKGLGQGLFTEGTILFHTEHPLWSTRKSAEVKTRKDTSKEAKAASPGIFRLMMIHVWLY